MVRREEECQRGRKYRQRQAVATQGSRDGRECNRQQQRQRGAQPAVRDTKDTRQHGDTHTEIHGSSVRASTAPLHGFPPGPSSSRRGRAYAMPTCSCRFGCRSSLMTGSSAHHTLATLSSNSPRSTGNSRVNTAPTARRHSEHALRPQVTTPTGLHTALLFSTTTASTSTTSSSSRSSSSSSRRCRGEMTHQSSYHDERRLRMNQ